MKPIGKIIAACLVAAAGAAPASAAGLEDIADGTFRGTGTIRQTPDASPERLTCRIKSRSGPKELVLKGRCATAAHSTSLLVTVEVVEPRKRYKLTSKVRGEVTRYTGETRGSGIVFSGPVVFDGIAYRSRFEISFLGNDIGRIVETVFREENSDGTTLVDIAIQRR